MANKSSTGSRFFSAIADAIGEVTHGAVADIRHRWEEAWFGREVTSDHAGNMAEKLGWSKASTQEKETAWDTLCNRLAKEHGQQPSREHEYEQDLDR